MNVSAKICLLTMGLATAFIAADSSAAIVAYGSAANAPARCQAFTPGPANTIRNRVVGSENIGASPIAVACTFEVEFASTSSDVIATDMYFSNNGSSAASVACTMLNGWQGAAGQIAVNKSVNVPAGAGNGTIDQAQVEFEAADTPDPSDTDLGFLLVGVNCTIPQSVVVNDTYVYWADQNGV